MAEYYEIDSDSVQVINGTTYHRSPDGTLWKITVNDKGKAKPEKVDTPDPIVDYGNRNSERRSTLELSTIQLVGYFMALGDDQATADGKVKQVSNEVAPFLYLYVLGNTQPLLDAISDLNEVIYPFMDTTAKAYIVAELTPV